MTKERDDVDLAIEKERTARTRERMATIKEIHQPVLIAFAICFAILAAVSGIIGGCSVENYHRSLRGDTPTWGGESDDKAEQRKLEAMKELLK